MQRRLLQVIGALVCVTSAIIAAATIGASIPFLTGPNAEVVHFMYTVPREVSICDLSKRPQDGIGESVRLRCVLVDYYDGQSAYLYSSSVCSSAVPRPTIEVVDDTLT